MSYTDEHGKTWLDDDDISVVNTLSSAIIYMRGKLSDNARLDPRDLPTLAATVVQTAALNRLADEIARLRCTDEPA